MVDWHILMAVVSVVILFLFSIRKFSEEAQKVSGKSFKSKIRKITSSPIRGTVIGAFVTSLIQSSSATTVILIGLVDAGLITFRNSLGIILGANIGTTITSQLIALKLTSIAPIFIILGFIVEISSKQHKNKLIGKTIFYFGLIFFSLSLVSFYLEPISSDPQIIELMSKLDNIFFAIFIGILITIFVQSSSITSGLVVILASQNLVSLMSAIGIILGANIGTTSTALIASLRSTPSGKKTAIAHFLFNLFGSTMVLTLIYPFVNLIQSLGGSPEQQVANAHLIFNVSITIIFLIVINLFEKIVERVYLLKIFSKNKTNS